MKYYSSPRWSNEIADCSMPMTFDTYSNCSYGCLYCFSQFQRAIGNGKESYMHKEVFPVNVEACCAIGDEAVTFRYADGRTERVAYLDIVEQARLYILTDCEGSFERLAEWGLIR